MKMAYRSFVDRSIALLSLGAAIFSGLLLVIIIGILFTGALPALNPYFVFTPEVASNNFNGAIGNAVLGTILISILATIFAVPFALGTAIYLTTGPRFSFAGRVSETILRGIFPDLWIHSVGNPHHAGH